LGGEMETQFWPKNTTDSELFYTTREQNSGSLKTSRTRCCHCWLTISLVSSVEAARKDMHRDAY
jgi:hypothetical protein